MAGKPDCGEHPRLSGTEEETLAKLREKTWGCDVSRGQEREISSVAVRG